MNQLLERNAVNLDKARRHVANLAHSLKTPSATLQLGVGRLEGPGKDYLAGLLSQIDLRVRHHLARARAGALAGPEQALCRIHADRAITLDLDAPENIAVACEAHDVDEIFGNLLDNAFKFARSRVACTARRDGRRTRVTIADDGMGLSSDDATLVLQPGRRLDEQVPGFGFGLTIARELVELYGGELRLEPGAPGLLTVVLLPSGAGAKA